MYLIFYFSLTLSEFDLLLYAFTYMQRIVSIREKMYTKPQLAGVITRLFGIDSLSSFVQFTIAEFLYLIYTTSAREIKSEAKNLAFSCNCNMCGRFALSIDCGIHTNRQKYHNRKTHTRATLLPAWFYGNQPQELHFYSGLTDLKFQLAAELKTMRRVFFFLLFLFLFSYSY